jgi:hypothetical protein
MLHNPPNISVLTYSKVERALTLIQNSNITIETIITDRAVPKAKQNVYKVRSPQDKTKVIAGKVSIAFSDNGWGSSTRAFSANAKASIRTPEKLRQIMDAAKGHEKLTRRGGATARSKSEDSDSIENDARAFLVDAEDDED